MKKAWLFNGGTLIGKELYGVQRYTYEILLELDKLVEPGKVKLLVPCEPNKKMEFSNIEVVCLNCNQGKKWSKFYWNHFVFPQYVSKEKGLGIDLLLALPLWGCDVVAIHDCIVELFPENAKTIREKIGRMFYLFRAASAIKRAKLVLTVSESSRNDIERLHNCSQEKIRIVANSWEHFKRILPDYNIIDKLKLDDRAYFFSLGSRYFHKNFRWIREAAIQNPQYLFVITGTENLNSSDRFIDMSIENIIYTGYLSDEEVKALMMKCKAFIQPSLYEGFGIPPMEAMSVGAKCIVADTSSLPEIYNKSVWYINPLNYNDIDIDAIMGEDIHDNQEVLERFSWRQSAEKLMVYLNEID